MTEDRLRQTSVRKRLLMIAQYPIAVAILIYLFYTAFQDDSFSRLRKQSSQWEASNWALLLGAFLAGLLAVSTTFFRWWGVVRALDLPFRIRDAFRLGFVGFLFNLLPMGVGAGDSLKAYFIAQQQPGRQTEAVSTVIVDRLIGLYALAMVAAIALLAVDVQDATVEQVLRVTMGFLVLGGIAGVLFVFWGGRSGKPDVDQLADSDTVGQRIVNALLLFRSKLGRLALLLLLSLVTHVLYALCVYMIACGLGGLHPSLGQHVVMVAFANVVSSVPGLGLGGFEWGLNFFYDRVAGFDNSEGFVVALGYRLVTISITLIGAAYYLSSRAEMRKLMQAAQAAEQREPSSDTESNAVDDGTV